MVKHAFCGSRISFFFPGSGARRAYGLLGAVATSGKRWRRLYVLASYPRDFHDGQRVLWAGSVNYAKSALT